MNKSAWILLFVCVGIAFLFGIAAGKIGWQEGTNMDLLYLDPELRVLVEEGNYKPVKDEHGLLSHWENAEGRRLKCNMSTMEMVAVWSDRYPKEVKPAAIHYDENGDFEAFIARATLNEGAYLAKLDDDMFMMEFPLKKDQSASRHFEIHEDRIAIWDFDKTGTIRTRIYKREKPDEGMK